LIFGEIVHNLTSLDGKCKNHRVCADESTHTYTESTPLSQRGEMKYQRGKYAAPNQHATVAACSRRVGSSRKCAHILLSRVSKIEQPGRDLWYIIHCHVAFYRLPP